MANQFSKQEIVEFEKLLDGFEDQLVLSKNVNLYQTDQTDMARANDTIYRPQPYTVDSEDGMDQSAYFGDKVQLSVPSSINIVKNVTFSLDAKEKRDALQENRLSKAASQRLASDVNIAIMNVVSNQASLVVPIAGLATGYDDVAKAEAIFNEQGIQYFDRKFAISTKDYNGMAGDLAKRDTFSGDVSKAYKKSYVGEIASFDTFKLDYANRLTAAAGGAITMSTLDAAVNYYVPAATVATVNGTNNVDNRYQDITVSATANVKAGDAFTVAGIEAVHHITKNTTGELKTFRVIEVVNGTTLKITPPMTTAQIATPAAAEKQYKNCENTAQSATAAITWLNIADARINPFWRKDAIEIIPGKLALDDQEGWSVMRGTTENGIEMYMLKQGGINDLKTKYRFTIFFGVNNLSPEQSGIMLFSQT
ncbi:MAG: P22 phage major capsid protein family protein [Cyclobacteriaceae bacterium]